MRAGIVVGLLTIAWAGLAEAQTMPLAAETPSPVQPAPASPRATGPAPATGSGGRPLSAEDLSELTEAARATAAATREAVNYQRVVPDILTQILAKLDKIEDKLDKVENAIKRETAPRRTGR